VQEGCLFGVAVIAPALKLLTVSFIRD